MQAIKMLTLSLAAGLLSINLAHADVCADIRAINAQAQSHFDGWKKEGADRTYASNFMLDGADSCSIGGNSNSYSCVWKFATPVDLGRAYAKMVGEIKACPPLEKEAPGIVNDKPDDKTQGDLRRQLEVTGFDYGDAQALVMIGSMQLTGGKTGVSRNELKFSFVKSSGRH
ncbi:vesicle formation protein [Herbaspirillum sp. LeCh32-8]|uniref:vesicle formation protein n=1 Tax=Herbaspirillum sp. LeCh32-8 TaxID=2821356 RepID=UPI001AE55DD5|nr:vesicle formation protein [Herbaspirillum sp. LeCh32-8]MBP0599745.1 vesicle formation protein [Herbaspirillum sp. LeCh32-8]